MIAARHRRVAVLAAAVPVALWCRLWRVAGEPLWLDEAYSAYAAARGWRFLWAVVPRYETHPPFYYALVRLWTLAFGDGLVALRALGLLAGLATLPLLAGAAHAIARRLGWRAARVGRLQSATVALAAVSIPLVEMSRQVRPYPLMILAYAAALVALLRMDARLAARRPLAGAAFAGYLLAAELLLWLHGLGAFWATALALACVAVMWGRATRRDRGWFAAGHLLLVVAWVPCLLIVRDQAPTWMATTWLRFDPADAARRLLVLYAVPGWAALAAAALAARGGARLWAAGTDGRRLLALIVATALVPTALSLGVSMAVTPVFLSRTLAPVAVPTLLLLAIGADGAPGLVAAAVLAANLLAVDIQARTGPPFQDWYGAIAWLRPRFAPGDAVLAYPNEGALPFERALRDGGLRWPVRPVPAPVPAFATDPGTRYPTGSRGVVALPPTRLEAIAREPAVAAIPTVWLLRLGPETYDPGNVFVRALRRDRAVVGHLRDGPIDLVGLRRRDRLRSPRAPARSPR